VFVDEPIAVRPGSKRYWPAHWVDDEWRATQAALEFELQIALANRMNVVGMHRHTGASGPDPGIVLAAHDEHAAHSDATHALLTTFVHDGVELELTVQLVECDSGWIVATARRRIVGFTPHAFDVGLGPPAPVAAIARVTASRPVTGDGALAEERAAGSTPAALTTPLVEGATGAPGDVPCELPALPSDELAQLELVEGPAAMRRRALDRIALEVAARVGEPLQ